MSRFRIFGIATIALYPCCLLNAVDRFEFDLSGASALYGAPGQTIDFHLDVRLKTLQLEPGSRGAEAWSIALALENCQLVEATIPESLGDLYFQHIQIDESLRSRLTCAVVLDRTGQVTLDVRRSPEAVLRLELRTILPGACGEARVMFADGIRLAAESVENLVVVSAQSVKPSLVGKTITLVPNAGCGAVTRSPHARFAIEAPLAVHRPTGSQVGFDAMITLDLNDDPSSAVPGADAWSVAIATEGCTIVSASLPDDIAALEPAFVSISDLPADQVVSTVVLDFRDPVRHLEPAALPHALLGLRLETLVGAHCEVGSIRFVDGTPGDAAPADNLFVSDQLGVRPMLVDHEFGIGPDPDCEPTEEPTRYVFSIDEREFGAKDVENLSVVIGASQSSGDTAAPAPPQGWSLALRVENAELESVVHSPDLPIDPQSSFAAITTRVLGGGRTTEIAGVVVLGLEEPTELPALDPIGRPVPWRVLDLEIRPHDTLDCDPWSVRFVNGARGDAGPVENLVAVEQSGYFPALVDHVRFRRIEAPCEDLALTEDSRVDRRFTLSACEPARCFRISAPAGASIVLGAEAIDGGTPPSIVARWGARVSAGSFDARSRPRGRAGEMLIIPAMRASELWVDVLNQGFSKARDFTFHARVSRFEILDMLPRIGAIGGRAGCTVRGSGFGPRTVFRLEREGFPSIHFDSSASEVLSSDTAEVLFSLDNAELGAYELVGVDPDLGRRVLVDALDVVTPQEVFGLDVSLTGQNRFRTDRLHTIWLEFENVGVVDVDAPFVRIRAPDRSFVGLPGARPTKEFLLIAATDIGGFAGRIPPGGRGRVPFLVESRLNLLPGQFETFEVDLFTPLRRDYLDWAERLRELLPDVDEATRLRLEEGLARELGTTWKEFGERCAILATRLARRGRTTVDPLATLRFAARRALGRPTASASGRLLSDENGSPLPGTLVAAFEGDRQVSFATTSSDGGFVLEHLEPGRSYEIRASGRLLSLNLRTPDQERDIFALVLRTTPGGAEFDGNCGNCDDSDLPETPISIPRDLDTPISTWPVRVLGPIDPNEKRGGGRITRNGVHHVSPNTELVYTIYMENLPRAGLPVQEATIIDDLDPSLDPDSVRFIDAAVKDLPPIQLGSESIPFSGAGNSLSADSAHGSIDVTHEFAGKTWNLRVHVNAEVDIATGRLTWRFSTTDLDAPGAPLAIDAGFLLPNVDAPQGEARVSFVVKQRRDLPRGRRIRNRARIRFERQPEIVTNWVEHEVNDFLPAEVPANPMPRDGEATDDATLGWQSDRGLEFELRLRRIDPPGRSVRMWVDSPRVRPIPSLEPGRWEWSATAFNILGNPTVGPTWTFDVTSPETLFRRGEIDGDGRLGISDPIALLGFLFLGSAEPRCLDAADLNDDGDLNVTDAVRTLGYLFLGTAAPSPPFEECGSDPTGDDELGCGSFPGC